MGFNKQVRQIADIPLKKLKSGFEMPVFGIGTWMMGGDKIRDPENDDQADVQAIKAAIESGVTHIDTAENYAQGEAEKLVAQAIKDFDRSKLFIVSKVSPNNLRYQDVLSHAQASLEGLGTDYLDLYLIHAPNPEIPIKEAMRAMDKLVNDGFVRNIGVSNFTKESLTQARACTQNKIAANQVHYNLIAEHTPSLRAGGKGAMGVPRGIPLWSDWGSKPPV